MGNETSRSNTHFANATGKHLRIFYEVDKMRLEELVINVGEEIGSSWKISTDAKMVFKPDSRIRYLRLPKYETCNFAGGGTIYASVLVEDENDNKNCIDVICLNYHIPSDRSFILTANHNIKLQKTSRGPTKTTLNLPKTPESTQNQQRPYKTTLNLPKTPESTQNQQRPYKTTLNLPKTPESTQNQQRPYRDHTKPTKDPLRALRTSRGPTKTTLNLPKTPESTQNQQRPYKTTLNLPKTPESTQNQQRPYQDHTKPTKDP
ncbi:hypothetical protein G5714_002637 [Onychostoma macrolepis]|uniref:Uncharacterized protein n=1 Tax=Onychostoma macrolepis TaxID=369639 RepID=A0A7J6D784_9TELE|nr:hypothetical protein G5714_002637 [Onychostoma macrolepis]